MCVCVCEELALLAGSDTDPFNRWEAMQRLGTKAVLEADATKKIEHASQMKVYAGMIFADILTRETHSIVVAPSPTQCPYSVKKRLKQLFE